MPKRRFPNASVSGHAVLSARLDIARAVDHFVWSQQLTRIPTTVAEVFVRTFIALLFVSGTVQLVACESEADPTPTPTPTACDGEAIGQTTSCGTGQCSATGVLTCVDGAVVDTCDAGVPILGPDGCDGVDSDCDGVVDEDFSPSVLSCGLGVCAATAMTSCVDGAVSGGCLPLAPLSGSDLTCDGLDDDCDGDTDEDVSPETVFCGVGACAVETTRNCVAGVWQGECQPLVAADADPTCDGIDDDCDGEVDEDFVGLAVTCGTGACAATDVQACVDGEVVDACEALPPTSAIDDACNLIDDDCDGETDEDVAATPTSCGTGACAAVGQEICVDGQLQDSCQAAGAVTAVDDTCNLIDDDCDGDTDEDVAAMPTSCGTGACAAVGQEICVDGQFHNSCQAADAVTTVDDTCDLIDDDCDGETDEDVAAMPTSCGTGACAAVGQESCVDGQLQDSCQPAGAVTAVDDTCNLIDDDCDGETDEDTSTTATCGQGACAATGPASCDNGIWTESCEPLPPLSDDDATCDGIDDDCDGVVDDEFVGSPTTCGVGACRTTGVTICTAGVEQSCQPLAPLAADDTTCDGIDDDCDGLTDEDVGDTSTCGLGACAATGSVTCIDGVFTDSCEPLAPMSADESTCDGIDNDCDGLVDEDFISLPSACGVDHPIICSEGAVVTTCGSPWERRSVVEQPDDLATRLKQMGLGLLKATDSRPTQMVYVHVYWNGWRVLDMDKNSGLNAPQDWGGTPLWGNAGESQQLVMSGEDDAIRWSTQLNTYANQACLGQDYFAGASECHCTYTGSSPSSSDDALFRPLRSPSAMFNYRIDGWGGFPGHVATARRYPTGPRTTAVAHNRLGHGATLMFGADSYELPGNPTGIVAADVDGDGLDDIIVRAGGLNVLYSQTTKLTVGKVSARVGELQTGDLNGDGFYDVIITSFGELAIHFGSAAGLTGEELIVPQPTGLAGVLDANDADGDGVYELIALAADRRSIEVYELDSQALVHVFSARLPWQAETLVAAGAVAVAMEEGDGEMAIFGTAEGDPAQGLVAPPSPAAPAPGDGNGNPTTATELDCDDAQDEDADGLYDCADPDCAASQGCDVARPWSYMNRFTNSCVFKTPSPPLVGRFSSPNGVDIGYINPKTTQHWLRLSELGSPEYCEEPRYRNAIDGSAATTTIRVSPRDGLFLHVDTASQSEPGVYCISWSPSCVCQNALCRAVVTDRVYRTHVNHVPLLETTGAVRHLAAGPETGGDTLIAISHTHYEPCTTPQSACLFPGQMDRRCPTERLVLMTASGTLVSSYELSEPSDWLGADDFDGDGLTDVAMVVGTQLSVRYGHADDVEVPVGEVGDAFVLIGDVNGDGVADIIDGASSGELAVRFGTVDGVGPRTTAGALAQMPATQHVLGDIDSDGVDELVYLAHVGHRVVVEALDASDTFAQVGDVPLPDIVSYLRLVDEMVVATSSVPTSGAGATVVTLNNISGLPINAPAAGTSYCGDGTCDTNIGEAHVTCPQDCGP